MCLPVVAVLVFLSPCIFGSMEYQDSVIEDYKNNVADVMDAETDIEDGNGSGSDIKIENIDYYDYSVYDSSGSVENEWEYNSEEIQSGEEVYTSYDYDYSNSDFAHVVFYPPACGDKTLQNSYTCFCGNRTLSGTDLKDGDYYCCVPLSGQEQCSYTGPDENDPNRYDYYYYYNLLQCEMW